MESWANPERLFICAFAALYFNTSLYLVAWRNSRSANIRSLYPNALRADERWLRSAAVFSVLPPAIVAVTAPLFPHLLNFFTLVAYIALCGLSVVVSAAMLYILGKKNLKSNVLRFPLSRFLTMSAISMAFLFLALASMRPQGSERNITIRHNTMNVMLVLDLSASMNADDVLPSRLSAAKSEAHRILDTLQNTKIGIVLFAASAYLLCPPTSDKNVLKNYLNFVDTSTLPEQGSDIGAALRIALERLKDASPERNASRGNNDNSAVIILSDGENNADNGNDALRLAEQYEIPVYTVAFGSSGGTTLKNPDGSTFLYNNVEVVSKPDFDFFKRISEESGGIAYTYSVPGDVAQRLSASLLKYRRERNERAYVLERVDNYRIFLFIALSFFALALLPTLRLKKYLRLLSATHR